MWPYYRRGEESGDPAADRVRPYPPHMHKVGYKQKPYYDHYAYGVDYFIKDGLENAYMDKKAFLHYLAVFGIAIHEFFEEMKIDPYKVVEGEPHP